MSDLDLSPQPNFQNSIFESIDISPSKNAEKTIEERDHLQNIEKLHDELLKCESLSEKQKLDICTREREEMKLYLKSLISKL